MVNCIINGIPVQTDEDATILEAASSAGIHIPTLCYLKGLNDIGACRVCLVEIEGTEKLATACGNRVREGMVIHTNSPRVREARRTNVELILSQHDCYCASCARSGNCDLQRLSNDLGILDLPYKRESPVSAWNPDFPLIRDFSKCIKCMRCVQVCDKMQEMHIWDIANTGSRTTVDVSGNRKIEDSDCTLCGQCITHCPVGALRERDDTAKVFDALADSKRITVVQVAPAVRAAWGELIGIPPEKATPGRMVAALRKIGFDYIFDTTFSADLTIMEEGSEFLARLQDRENQAFPLFTSCCPGWVRFCKSQYPQLAGQLSTAKSPQQMFGAVTKSYFAELLQVRPEQICCISVMPCLAKKEECTRPTMDTSGAGQDVDIVLTTRELQRMLRAEDIHAEELEEEAFDSPLGEGSGAGVIFGATGGVMEAALRTAYFLVTGENPDPDAFYAVRGLKGWKEASFDIAGATLRVAVVSGLANTRALLEALRRKEVAYDFVEVMACPGGCAGGGGQPIIEGKEMAGARGACLYGLDKANALRFSHENPVVAALYRDYLGQPLSARAHHLLHTAHDSWQMPGIPAAEQVRH